MDEMNGEKPVGDGGETPSETPSGAQVDVEALQMALKRANREAAERRKKIEEMEAAETKRKEAELTELERLKAKTVEAEARLETMAARLRESAIRQEVMVQAGKLAFVDADDAFRLADLSGVEVGEDGKVIGVEAALRALAKQKPHLLKPAGNAPNINAGASGRSSAATPAEIAVRKRAEYAPI